jgi:hypothetical protein
MKFQNDALLHFHPSHNSGRATQHGHNQTKLRGKPTDIEGQIQYCSIQEGSRSITFHSLPTPTSFPSTVHAVLLFYSHTVIVIDISMNTCKQPHFCLSRDSEYNMS